MAMVTIGKKIMGRILARLGVLIPDELYLYLKFRYEMGEWPNLSNPKTFNEKLNWLKLHNRNPEYTRMVDKLLVKEYVCSRLNPQIIIPTIAVWDTPEQIEWDKLPDRFVLKTTHGGGGNSVIICKDKSSLDIQAALRKLKKAMDTDIYKTFREWPYKNVVHKVFAEQYLDGGDDLYDYKFFCFNGKVRCFKIDFCRFIDHHANYFDRTGKIMPFGESKLLPDYSKKLLLPENLNEMASIAERLSERIPFVRVDLYNVEGKIHFGEMTFFPAAGMGSFSPREWDGILGDWLNLDDVKQ